MAEVCIFVCPLMLEIILRQFIELLYSEHLWYGRNHERQIRPLYTAYPKGENTLCLMLPTLEQLKLISDIALKSWSLNWPVPSWREQRNSALTSKARLFFSTLQNNRHYFLNKQSVASNGRRAVWRFPLWSGALIEGFQTSARPKGRRLRFCFILFWHR